MSYPGYLERAFKFDISPWFRNIMVRTSKPNGVPKSRPVVARGQLIMDHLFIRPNKKPFKNHLRDLTFLSDAIVIKSLISHIHQRFGSSKLSSFLPFATRVLPITMSHPFADTCTSLPYQSLPLLVGASIKGSNENLSTADIFNILESVEDVLNDNFDFEPLPFEPELDQATVIQISPASSPPNMIFDLFEEKELDEVLDPVMKRKVDQFCDAFQSSPIEKKQRKSEIDFCFKSSCHDNDYLVADKSSYDVTILEAEQVICEDEESARFRGYQSEQWSDRFQDLVHFQRQRGHCLVPHNFQENPTLAQWVKRQRYQYKLKQEGKHSTLSDERETALDDLGFVWDSHAAAWEERWKELFEYRLLHGNANVPTNYAVNKTLAVWVKCQRRQYRLYVSGKRSNMTADRVVKMESLDFDWNPRKL